MENVYRSYPAGDVVIREPAPDFRGGCMEVKAGEGFALMYKSRNHGELFHEYKAGSVISYALKNGDDPIAALKRCEARGEALHYMIPCGASVVAWERPRFKLIKIEIGQIIRFEGRFFEVCKARNDNIELKPVESPKGVAA